MGSDPEADEGFEMLCGLDAKDVSPIAWENEERASSDMGMETSKPPILKSPLSDDKLSSKFRSLPSYVDVPDTNQLFSFAYKNSGHYSPDGRVELPAVKIVDLSSYGKGNGLVTTKKIRRGDVLYTERAAAASQVPGTTEGMAAFPVRACQTCFRSLEPVSSCCLENGKNLPEEHLWPVGDFVFEDDSSTPKDVLVDVHGRMQCKECRTWCCSGPCWTALQAQIGGCCGLHRAVVSLPVLGTTADGPEVQPAVALAVRLFRIYLERHRTNSDIEGSFVEGLCGDEADVVPLELGVPSCNSDGMLDFNLHAVYDRLITVFNMTADEQSTFSLSLFHQLAAISARNGVGLMTQSPFKGYYAALLRTAGGRGSAKHEEMKAQVAAALGSESGQLERGMDRRVEARVAPEIVAIFPLTAKINHSCVPNTEVRGQEFTDCHMDLVALQDIEAGEEVTISYISRGHGHGLKNRAKRQRELQAKYLFVCECQLCRNDVS